MYVPAPADRPSRSPVRPRACRPPPWGPVRSGAPPTAASGALYVPALGRLPHPPTRPSRYAASSPASTPAHGLLPALPRLQPPSGASPAPSPSPPSGEGAGGGFGGGGMGVAREAHPGHAAHPEHPRPPGPSLKSRPLRAAWRGCVVSGAAAPIRVSVRVDGPPPERDNPWCAAPRSPAYQRQARTKTNAARRRRSTKPTQSKPPQYEYQNDAAPRPSAASHNRNPATSSHAQQPPHNRRHTQPPPAPHDTTPQPHRTRTAPSGPAAARPGHTDNGGHQWRPRNPHRPTRSNTTLQRPTQQRQLAARPTPPSSPWNFWCTVWVAQPPRTCSVIRGCS